MNRFLYETAHISLVVLFMGPAILGFLLCLPLIFVYWIDDQFTSDMGDLP